MSRIKNEMQDIDLTPSENLHTPKHPIELMSLDYTNNFLTIERFAEHYGISEQLAELIVKEGKNLYKADK